MQRCDKASTSKAHAAHLIVHRPFTRSRMLGTSRADDRAKAYALLHRPPYSLDTVLGPSECRKPPLAVLSELLLCCMANEPVLQNPTSSNSCVLSVSTTSWLGFSH